MDTCLTTLDMLRWLQAKMYRFSLEVNDHRGCYHTVGEELALPIYGDDDFDSPESRSEAVRRNQLVCMRVFPDTNADLLDYFDYDVGRAIEAAYRDVAGEPVSSNTDATVDKLRWLQENACSFSLDGNEHRASYEKIEVFLAENDRYSDLDEEARAECIRHDRVVLVQMYPDTPVGFVCFVDHDIDRVICAAYDWLSRGRGVQ